MKIRLLIILFVYLLFSCNNEESSQHNILNNIFIPLSDSISIYARNLFLEPLPPTYDTDSIFVNIDSGEIKEVIKRNEKALAEFENYPPKILLGIYDSLFLCKEDDLNYIDEKINNKIFNEIINKIGKEKVNSSPLKLQEINITDKFELISFAKTENNYLNYWKTPKRKLAGILMFSKIYLNVKKDHGVIYFEYQYMYREAFGSLILIKRIEDIWRIIRIIGIWVS